ncbi:mechanosensitive ion channel [Exilibacterium tricleocarpae]|uniref:Small-conductance mechanosensitive channel n=1 Tax=Exilibacterium tricleocarpae TaxID=2591008 RepID=A0A545TLJ1_9GAMM|nr:mechanosensitive ion channel domain-containing protein [Exilibacterium tricleocarpae]TQV78084.1 mechanosensitive ion channel [Exilibacterium tricleocarpae]
MEQELEYAATIYHTITEFFVNYSFQIAGALIILAIGIWVAARVSTAVFNLCQRHNLDVTLSQFIANVIRLLTIAMVAIIALNKLGISVTPLVAAIGAVSLGAGLALQGLLSNYGAGLNIVLTRPFVVGDTISVQGVTGLVKEVRLGYTLLTNEDEVEIIIPNKHIVGEIIHNSRADTLLELHIGIAYHCDPVAAVRSLENAITQVAGINTQRAPQIGIDEFADSSINLQVRVWIPTSHFHEVRFRANHAIHSALREAGIDIPFPQREVTLLPVSEGPKEN